MFQARLSTCTIATLLVLSLSPARAIDRAYLGAWTSQPGNCRFDGFGPIKITPNGMEEHETDCRTKTARSEGGGWSVTLSCAAEGDTSLTKLHWKLLPNGHLEERIKGKVTDYVRCLESGASLAQTQPASQKDSGSASYRAKALAFLAGDAADANTAGSNPNFSVTLVDLNGDGVPEALAVDSSPESCGSHGCSGSVLDLRGAKARSLGDFIAFDLKALPTKTGGWRDVSVNGHKQVFRAGKYVVAR